VARVDRIPCACAGGVRVCINGVIDDFLTDPLSEITRSRAPLGLPTRERRRVDRERTEGERDPKKGSEGRHSPSIVIATRSSSCSPLQKAENCSTPPPLTLSSSSSFSHGNNIARDLQ